MSDSDTPRPAGSSDDDTFARLQAADPAADASIDLTAVRREVDRRIAERPTAGAPTGRTPRWLQIAAVAATVALVGTASFVVGRETGGGEDSVAAGVTTSTAMSAAVGEQAPVPAVGLPVSPPAMGPVQQGAEAGASKASAQDRSFVGWAGGGRTHFNDGGLATDAGSAEAWGYDPTAVVNAATAERIAAAMGIQGTAVVQYQTWTVGPTDGSGPTVNLMGDGTASVSYYDPQAAPSCSPDAPAPDAAAAGSDVAGSCAAPTPTDISADDAVARSTEVLARIGLDPAAYTISAPDDQAGSGYRTVLAVATVDGRAEAVPAGSFGQWSFTYAGDRLSGFYGGLAPLVDLGEYAVISPAEAVARMNDPRFGTSQGPMPVDIMTAARTEPAVPAEPDPNVVPQPVAPVPGAPIAWPVREITLTNAVLGLTSQYQADGSVLLLPAYTMTDDSGASWTVVAVADDELDFTG